MYFICFRVFRNWRVSFLGVALKGISLILHTFGFSVGAVENPLRTNVGSRYGLLGHPNCQEGWHTRIHSAILQVHDVDDLWQKEYLKKNIYTKPIQTVKHIPACLHVYMPPPRRGTTSRKLHPLTPRNPKSNCPECPSAQQGNPLLRPLAIQAEDA